LCAARTPDIGRDEAAVTLDVGAQNCAALIMHARNAMAILAPGEILAVVAYDPSAPLDLRAWSRMTGHLYLRVEDHGRYTVNYLRKRDEPHGEDPGVR
jgi:tRNA 2-thiouridine synthesizing protein A